MKKMALQDEDDYLIKLNYDLLNYYEIILMIVSYCNLAHLHDYHILYYYCLILNCLLIITNMIFVFLNLNLIYFYTCFLVDYYYNDSCF